MSGIQDQVHAKFKVFSGKLAADNTLGSLAGTIEAWVRDAKVAPKSIGVEYLESSKLLVLSVGYRDDEAAYGVALRTVKVGQVGMLDATGTAALEQAMGKACAGVSDIICHELYVTDGGDLLMVLMTRA